MYKRAIITAVILGLLAPAGAYAAPNEKAAARQSEAVKQRVEEAKKDATEKSNKAREAAEARKLTLQQEKCEARQDKLTALVPKLSTSVQSVKKKLDEKYAKVTAIYDSGKLTVDNYTELDTAIQEAKGEAEVTIAMIKPESVTVDCASNSLGAQLDSYRATVNEAKTALKDYHKALVELVSGLNASADKVSTDDEEPGDTATDETTTETPEVPDAPAVTTPEEKN